jgi:pyruvate/2-oxoglutarate dehydrogenase complex dihydrolipoamide acyltransferase (E2) component
MHVDVILPKIGFAMDEGVIAEWLAKDGDTVAAGQPLFNLESDKSVQEIESPANGVLKIVGEVGATYKVGDVLATID